MQNGVHLFGDRHLHAASVRQAYGRGGRKNAFRDHSMHAGNDVWQLPPPAEFNPDAAIS
jgi:hypothetical protein